MSKKTLLIIAAVAVMLVAATNASAYTERWNGWVQLRIPRILWRPL